MSLPLHELAVSDATNAIVRLTENGLEFGTAQAEIKTSLIPTRALGPGEQYRFHFNMTKCVGCRSCEVACNEQNGNPADIRWRRIGEIEGGSWPNTSRFYLSMGCNHCLSADCLRGIFRARGVVLAALAQQRGEHSLIHADQEHR